MFLPGFKYRGRIKRARGRKNTGDTESKEWGNEGKKSTKRRDKDKIENIQRERRKKKERGKKRYAIRPA